MKCGIKILPNGVTVIVCYRGADRQKRCAWCHHEGGVVKLCDFLTGPDATCDKPLCAEHAHSVGPGIDLCPAHFNKFQAEKASEEEIHT